MISRLGHAMPRMLAGANFAGEGMRERLRTATFALFGLVTAVGLILVGIAYNQGWPDFADSPIPGIPIERVGEATIAADAVHGSAHTGPASSRSAQAGQTDFVDGRSRGHRSSSHQQLPVTVPDGQVPGPASSVPGGVDAPGSPAPAPAPQAAEPTPSVGPQPGEAEAPVATSPPASQTPDVTSPPGKGKGHEKPAKAEEPAKPEKPAKAEKPEKPHGKTAPVASVVPTPPAVHAPGQATPEPPAADGPGNGNGKAKGHDK